MFTGIIKKTGKVFKVEKKNKGYEIEVLSNLVFIKKDMEKWQMQFLIKSLNYKKTFNFFCILQNF